MGEGEGPEEENLAEEASVKSTVSISRWPLITFRTTRYLNNFYSTRSSSLSLVSSFSVYTRENSIENLNHNENRPSQSCPTSPTKIALSFDSPLLNKVAFEKSFRLFVKLITDNQYNYTFVEKRQPFKKLWWNSSGIGQSPACLVYPIHSLYFFRLVWLCWCSCWCFHFNFWN